MASAATRSDPFGASSRVQRLPKLSVYDVIDLVGVTRSRSGVTKSGVREGCTLTMKIIGVGSAHSNVISKPM
jgi:hypothetical protein